jgi:hypothetical protein
VPQTALLFSVMSHLTSPLFLLLRDLSQFLHPNLIFFRSLMSCRSPLDPLFLLMFVQEQVSLVLAAPLYSWLPPPLVLPCARVPQVPLARKRIYPLDAPNSKLPGLGCHPLPFQAGPVGPSPRPSKLGPVHTCPNRSSRWPLPLVHRQTTKR